MARCLHCDRDYGDDTDYAFCLDCGERLAIESESPTVVVTKAAAKFTLLPDLCWSNETLLTDGRILVDTPPEYLHQLLDSEEFTISQVECILKSYEGKWINIKGTLRETQPFLGKQLVYINRGESFQGVTFKNENQIALLNRIKKNSPVHVIGKVAITDDYGVIFEEGEIIG